MLLYSSEVLGGASNVLWTLRFWSSHWFLTWSSVTLFRTSSQMGGRLYLQIFLLRFRLSTVMNMGTFIVLVKPCPSLSTVLKLSTVVGWPLIEWLPMVWDMVFFKCSLNLSPNVAGWFFYVFIITIQLLTPVLIDNSTFMLHWVLILWWHKYILKCSVALEVCLDPILTTNVS